MTEGFDGELERMLQQNANQEEANRRIGELAARYTAYLTDRGEVFSLTQEEAAFYRDMPEVVTRDHFSSQAEFDDYVAEAHRVIEKNTTTAMNGIDVLMIATQRLFIEEVELFTGETPQVNIKKHVLAHLMVAGRNDSWLDLVSEDFPGEGLSLDDSELVDREAIEDFTLHEQNQATLDAMHQEIREILFRSGKIELNDTELMAVAQVAGWACILTPELRAQDIENMRLNLETSGVFDQHWAAVLQQLTQPPQDQPEN